VEDYSVYVVELSRDAGTQSKARGCVYVGETGLTPEERFSRHMKGGRTSSPKVFRHGVRLRPDLSFGFGPYETRDEALAAEAALAAKLRSEGYEVFGGQGTPFMSDG
jgi:hypothetical protein